MTTLYEEALLARRDAKTKPHLTQYAPVWIIEQQIIPEDDAVVFNVIFRHNQYGWVSRRYKFDGFNDVLYHKGQTVMSEAVAVEYEENDPYIRSNVADIPNAYGG